MKIISVVVSVCLSLPLYLYLLYKILVHIEATELMWFLYYVYVPVIFLSSFLFRMYEESDKD